jgi:hypothetical protein
MPKNKKTLPKWKGLFVNNYNKVIGIKSESLIGMGLF